MKPKIVCINLLIILIVSCTPRTASEIPTTKTPEPVLTTTLLAALPATPQKAISTEMQLPWNPEAQDENGYCQSAPTDIPASLANGLDEDEIARKLMEQWLAYFNAPQAPDYCRIDDYHIDKVYYDERTPYLPLEPKGDFIRMVQFSIQLIQIPNFWMSWAGEIDQQNWLHTGNAVAVFRLTDGYAMKFAYP